jgi:hypothetical protein
MIKSVELPSDAAGRPAAATRRPRRRVVPLGALSVLRVPASGLRFGKDGVVGGVETCDECIGGVAAAW